MSEMPISLAGDLFGEAVSGGEHVHEHVVLTRHGRPVAAIVSIDDLRRLEAAEDEVDLAAAREALASTEPRIPHHDVLAGFGDA